MAVTILHLILFLKECVLCWKGQRDNEDKKKEDKEKEQEGECMYTQKN